MRIREIVCEAQIADLDGGAKKGGNARSSWATCKPSYHVRDVSSRVAYDTKIFIRIFFYVYFTALLLKKACLFFRLYRLLIWEPIYSTMQKNAL